MHAALFIVIILKNVEKTRKNFNKTLDISPENMVLLPS